MSVPKSFISYMKTMRDYYKSGAPCTDPLPVGFHFDDIEIKTDLYYFFSKEGDLITAKKDVENNMTKKYFTSSKHENKNTTTAIEIAIEESDTAAGIEQADQPKQTELFARTDIITLELFEPNSMKSKRYSKSDRKAEKKPEQRPEQKPRLTIAEKISRIFYNKQQQ